MNATYETASSPTNLSFVSSATGRLDLWADAPESDSWADGNNEGSRRANELVDHMSRHHQPSLLGHVVRAIAERRAGRGFGAIETGFFSRLALLATTREARESASIIPFVLNPGAETSAAIVAS